MHVGRYTKVHTAVHTSAWHTSHNAENSAGERMTCSILQGVHLYKFQDADMCKQNVQTVRSFAHNMQQTENTCSLFTENAESVHFRAM